MHLGRGWAGILWISNEVGTVFQSMLLVLDNLALEGSGRILMEVYCAAHCDVVWEVSVIFVIVRISGIEAGCVLIR